MGNSFLLVIFKSCPKELQNTLLTTFKHRTMFYCSRANLNNNVKLKVDLTKNR